MSESDNVNKSLPVKGPDAAGPVIPARRRLLHGGLAAAPVLLTLVSRPVLGTAQCVTPSAFCSGNASVAGAGIVCEGHTADYWLDASWPPPFTPDTPFNDVFGSNPDYACETLLDVLSPPETGLPDLSNNSSPSGHTHGHTHEHSHSHGSASHDQAPHDQGPRELGPPTRHHTDFSALDPVVAQSEPVDQAPLQAKALGLSANRSKATDPTTLHHSTNHGGAGNHPPRSHRHDHHPSGEGQGTDTSAPSNPVTTDPLACNNNANTTPDPVSSASSNPSPSGHGRRHHSSHHSRGLRAPTRHDALARMTVAALLNAQAGYTPAVSVNVVKGIWREYVSKGYFEPTAGVQWTVDDIMTYLASTQLA